MKKFEGILLCTDLDGTLLRSDTTISKENTDAIEYFKSEGGLFTFITGRVPSTARGLYKAVRPNAPIGCFNGGGIYDFETESYVWTKPLPPSAIELLHYVDERMEGIGIQINTFDKVYFCRENITMQSFRLFTGVPFLTVSPDEVREPIAKIIFGAPTEEHPLAENFDFIRSERALYEILPKGISKGSALLQLCRQLGIDPARTIAVGDYENDVSMIRAAGLGVAVANACEEAKRAADLITVSNDENAIAALIGAVRAGKGF